MAKQNSVILLSGGLDSAVALAISKAEGFAPHALTVDYGQRHHAELDAARRVAEALGVKRHIVLKVDLTQWGGSALTDDSPVPEGRDVAAMGQDIPVTYVPARNTILLSLATAWAETLETGDIFIGAHTLDYSGYPDCRPEYFDAFANMANLATKAGLEGTTKWRIHAPLLHMNKTQIIRRGSELNVPFELTVSCYQAGAAGRACGVCDSCILRHRAFVETGVPDPTLYAVEPAQG
jgi:7-cyano-7-deazaguanine synthase